MDIQEKIIEIKDKTVIKAKKTFEYCKEHKSEIFCTIVIAGAGILCYQNKSLSEENSVLRDSNLKLQNSNLEKDSKIFELQEINDNLGKLVKSLSSEGLRHHSSVCGRMMADMKYH